MKEQRVKVAVVLPRFGNGGAERVVAELLSSLDLQQVLPKVFCVYGAPLRNGLEQMVLTRGIEIVYIGKGKGFSVAAVRKLASALKEFAPDVIHTHLYACMYALPWAVLNRVGMLHTFHSLPEVENGRLLRKLSMGCAILCGAVRPVAISRSNQQCLCAYYHLPPERVPVVENPVNLAHFQCARSPSDHIRLVTVGRLSPEKNQALMLRAFRRALDVHPELTLTIAGSGPEEAALQTLSRELQLDESVQFLGHIDDVSPVLEDGDIFLLSSRYEGLPVAMLEAMAAGLPIVSADVGGVSDLVTDGENGFLVPSEDADAMAEEILHLVETPALRVQMGTRSEQIAERFDRRYAAEAYLSLYRSYTGAVEQRKKESYIMNVKKEIGRILYHSIAIHMPRSGR